MEPRISLPAPSGDTAARPPFFGMPVCHLLQGIFEGASGVSFGGLGAILEPLGAILGLSCGLLGPLRAILGGSGGLLGRLQGGQNDIQKVER